MTNLKNQIETFQSDMDLAHDIIHGDESTIVTTESGDRSSIAKEIQDKVRELVEELDMPKYILQNTAISNGSTFKLEIGDEGLPVEEREPISLADSRVHQITVNVGSVRVIATVSNGLPKSYITISADDEEPTVPLLMAGLTQLHLEALEDSEASVVGY